MKPNTTLTKTQGKKAKIPTSRLDPVSTGTEDVTPVVTKRGNRSHRLTKHGIEYDQSDPTTPPNMTTPILPSAKKKQAESIFADRTNGRPGSRSQELESLLGRTIKLSLREKHVVQSVAFVSNKGGVGKTHCASNMAFYLARMGKKVLLIDLDLGNSDITNKLGFYCENTVVDLLEGKRNVGQLIYTTPHGFDLIGGESGNVRLANLNAPQKKRFIRALREMGSDYEYVLYDLGAGINSTTLDFALAQDFQIVITTPQDIVAGYSCIKAAYHRFQELETKMAHVNPDYKRRTTFRPFVVVNQAPDFNSGRDLYERLLKVTKQCIPRGSAFSLNCHFLGAVTSDQTRIRNSELDRYLYSSQHGVSRTGQCFNFLVENLVKFEDSNKINFTSKIKRFMDIFMHSVEESKYAK